MQLLDGKKISEQIKTEIASRVAKMKANGEKFLTWQQLSLEMMVQVLPMLVVK